MSENAKRDYWQRELDQAHSDMMEIMKSPVAECGEPLVSLENAAAAAGVTVLFSQTPYTQGFQRLHYLREGQIPNFIAAALAMNERGWIMRIEDGFRSRAMQKSVGLQPIVFDAILAKVIWELGGTKPEPDFLFKRILTLTAQMPKVGTHMSGSAIDISVIERASGNEVDRGGPYLEMSEKTPMASPFISATARANRDAIVALMRRAGFIEYPYEFWHFNSGDAYESFFSGSSKPARYGAIDRDAASNTVTAIENPCTPLNALSEIEAAIEASLVRQGIAL